MAVSIDQKPLYTTLPIGQQIIFSVSEPTIVATKFKVKFIAKVYVSITPINLSNDGQLIGTFKTTPNNAGVGIFDFRPILETFLKPDYEGSTFWTGSQYKTSSETHPIHLIDKFAVSENSIRFFAVKFDIEYSETDTGAVIPPSEQTATQEAPSVTYLMFNGVLQYDDVLSLFQNDYGYFLGFPHGNNFFLDNTAAKFLTNSPASQYARLTDYGTLPFLNHLPLSTDKVQSIVLTYYNDAGVQIGTETVPQTVSTGGTFYAGSYAFSRLMYFGAFPANLRNWSTIFQTLVTADTISYYTLYANISGAASSQTYTINILCPNLRGYEAVRLTWLNQWGTWDYYTFNMKSTRSIRTKKTSYTQLGGTWNESTFKISGWKGGKKNFRVNSTEKIKLNTDFVTEAEGVWFEELINSNEVYIVNGFSTDTAITITNKYVEPVRLTTSSYVKKTIANDKLMQYTIEIEKSKMERTQAV
jgi:hypothetical protein